VSHFTFKSAIDSLTECKVIDPNVHNNVVVFTKGDAYSPYGDDLVDVRWNPFNGAGSELEYDDPTSVKHTVQVTQKFLGPVDMVVAVKLLRDYYDRNENERWCNSTMVTLPEMGDAEAAYIVNTWLAIIIHFGPEAPYSPKFLHQMSPVSAALTWTGMRKLYIEKVE